jgi:hypothetical protein
MERIFKMKQILNTETGDGKNTLVFNPKTGELELVKSDVTIPSEKINIDLFRYDMHNGGTWF